MDPSVTLALMSLWKLLCAKVPMDPPSLFAVQKASVPNCIFTVVARCPCSNLQLASQPSRFVMLPSSHCSPLGSSRKLSPHEESLHTAPRQMLPTPHVAPSALSVPV